MTTCSTLGALYAAILENPHEDTPRLAYADELDEQGDTSGRAEFIRLQIHLYRNPFDQKAAEAEAWRKITAPMSRMERGDPQLKSIHWHRAAKMVHEAEEEWNKPVERCRQLGLKVGIHEFRDEAVLVEPMTPREQGYVGSGRGRYVVYRRGFPVEVIVSGVSAVRRHLHNRPFEVVRFTGGDYRVEVDPPDGEGGGWQAYWYVLHDEDYTAFQSWETRAELVGGIEGWMRRVVSGSH